jgi:phosphoribosylaminoimidazole-succinocarboxamide synthase
MMETELVRILNPKKSNGYDYSVFLMEKNNFLIPLEVIYRNTLPEGSSIFRRLEKKELTLEQLGLAHYPSPGEVLSKPILDVSTKLEDQDRYLDWTEAEKISGLHEDEIEKIREITLEVNTIITDNISKAGIENEDGKLEFAFNGKRELMVVDTIGTPDECRFSFDGMQISKEVLRRYYRKTEWFKDLEKLKGKEDWRDKAGIPPKMNEDLRKSISDVYKACCNEITRKRFFEVESLGAVIKNIRRIVKD